MEGHIRTKEQSLRRWSTRCCAATARRVWIVFGIPHQPLRHATLTLSSRPKFSAYVLYGYKYERTRGQHWGRVQRKKPILRRRAEPIEVYNLEALVLRALGLRTTRLKKSRNCKGYRSKVLQTPESSVDERYACNPIDRGQSYGLRIDKT